jgi:hypothetical protein
MIMISVADTQLPTTKSNEVAKDCVKWASNLATGGPMAAKIFIDTRSVCTTSVTVQKHPDNLIFLLLYAK